MSSTGRPSRSPDRRHDHASLILARRSVRTKQANGAAGVIVVGVTDEHDVPSRLSIDCTGSTLVVAGELDAHSAPALRERIAASDDAATVLDMSGVTFMDSSGLRVLIDAHQAAAGRGTQLVVHEPSPSVRRILEIAGVLDHLDVRGPSAPDSAPGRGTENS